MIEGATLLLTGGAGFIGTALTRRLVEKNRVRVFDNLRRNALAEAGRHTDVVGEALQAYAAEMSELQGRARAVIDEATAAGLVVEEGRVRPRWGVTGEADPRSVDAREARGLTGAGAGGVAAGCEVASARARSRLMQPPAGERSGTRSSCRRARRG